MNRNSLIKQLHNYGHRFPQEKHVSDQIIDFITRNENCFDRTNLAGHIVGSAWVVDDARKSVLLTHHAKLGMWIQLGGHADGEENVVNVALREAQEESGLDEFKLASQEILDVDVHMVPERGDEPEHFHFDIRFIFEADKDKPLTISEESNDLKWVSFNDLDQYNTEKTFLIRMRDKTKVLG